MNRLTVIAVAVAVVVTITVATLLSKSSAGSLPVPHIPAATAGHHAASRSTSGRSGTSGGGSNGGRVGLPVGSGADAERVLGVGEQQQSPPGPDRGDGHGDLDA